MTEEAADETLPSIPEMAPGVPGVVALAEQQQHIVGLQAVHTHGRSHPHLHKWPWTEGRKTNWEEEETVEGGERWNEEAWHHGVSRRVLSRACEDSKRRERSLRKR